MLSGALCQEYGDFRVNELTVMDVQCLPSPENPDNSADLIYKAYWFWVARRPLGARATVASWVIEPRGEGYTDKRITTMALFRTYNGRLDDQAEAQRAWDVRLKATEATHTSQQTYRQMIEHFNEAARVVSAQGVNPQSPQIEPAQETEQTTYILKRAATTAEPTNEDLGLPPLGPQYEQPPWHV